MYWHGRLVIPTSQRFCSSQQVARWRDVSISSPSSEGGGSEECQSLAGAKTLKFPLVLLQAKVVGCPVLSKTNFQLVRINPSGGGAEEVPPHIVPLHILCEEFPISPH
jgi:hypothetical protein